MKGTQQRPSSAIISNNHHQYSNSPVKPGPLHRKQPPSRPLDDVVNDDWISGTPKKKPTRISSFSDKKAAQNAAVVESDVNRIIRSVAEESTSIIKSPEKTISNESRKNTASDCTLIVQTQKHNIDSNKINENCNNRRSVRMNKNNEKRKHMQVKNLKKSCSFHILICCVYI